MSLNDSKLAGCSEVSLSFSPFPFFFHFTPINFIITHACSSSDISRKYYTVLRRIGCGPYVNSFSILSVIDFHIRFSSYNQSVRKYQSECIYFYHTHTCVRQSKRRFSWYLCNCFLISVTDVSEILIFFFLFHFHSLYFNSEYFAIYLRIRTCVYV